MLGPSGNDSWHHKRKEHQTSWKFAICVILHWPWINLHSFLALTVLIMLLVELGCFCWLVLDVAPHYILSTRYGLCMIMSQKLPSYVVLLQDLKLTEWSTIGLTALLYLNSQSLPELAVQKQHLQKPETEGTGTWPTARKDLIIQDHKHLDFLWGVVLCMLF